MFDACPVHPKGTMVIPMLWRISGYVVCMLGVKNQKLHIPPYHLIQQHAMPTAQSLPLRHQRRYRITESQNMSQSCLDRGRPKKWPQRELFRFAFAARRLPSDEGALLWAEHIKSSQPSAEAPPRTAYLR